MGLQIFTPMVSSGLKRQEKSAKCVSWMDHNVAFLVVLKHIIPGTNFAQCFRVKEARVSISPSLLIIIHTEDEILRCISPRYFLFLLQRTLSLIRASLSAGSSLPSRCLGGPQIYTRELRPEPLTRKLQDRRGQHDNRIGAGC
jgi:hypothetical protein